MQIYTRFFGRKSGALGICYWHAALVHVKTFSIEDATATLYSIGYESVSNVEVSFLAIHLTAGMKLFNQTNGLIRQASTENNLSMPCHFLTKPRS